MCGDNADALSPRPFAERNFMLYKVKSKSDVYNLSDFPDAVISELESITGTLDACYNRFGYDGGYALVAETVDDLQEVKAHHIDYTTEPAELIREINGFVCVLYLPATEYSVSLILPKELSKEVIP